MPKSKQDIRTEIAAYALKKYGLKLYPDDEILVVFAMIREENKYVKNVLLLLCFLVFVLIALLVVVELPRFLTY